MARKKLIHIAEIEKLYNELHEINQLIATNCEIAEKINKLFKTEINQWNKHLHSYVSNLPNVQNLQDGKAEFGKFISNLLQDNSVNVMLYGYMVGNNEVIILSSTYNHFNLPVISDFEASILKTKYAIEDAYNSAISGGDYKTKRQSFINSWDKSSQVVVISSDL